MTEREPLKMALEALEYASTGNRRPEVIGPAITAIKEALAQPAQKPKRCSLCNYQHGHAIGCANNPVDIAIQALAQPEQEPVATDWERIDRVQNAKLRAMCDEAGGFEKLCKVMDKYERTTPPQRTWVGLTDEEMHACWDSPLTPLGMKHVRMIEAKLKEKNT